MRKGLIQGRAKANAGLAALQGLARLKGPLSTYHLGFVIGPRINAGGRIGEAALGARLLTSDDPQEAMRIAARLDELNKERQAIEQIMLDDAVDQAEGLMAAGSEPAVLVVQSSAWHPGVVGLIASRLKDRYRRPTFAVALDEAGQGAGSGRSLPGVDLGAAVRAAVEAGILVKGGGHGMAAGMTIDAARVSHFSDFLQDALETDVQVARQSNALKIDAALTAAGAHADFIESLETAGPFGSGHAEPVFAFPTHTVTYAEEVGAGHVRCAIAGSDRNTLKAIAFRAADTPLGALLLKSRGRQLHVAGALSIDHWQGGRKPQLRVLDAAEPARGRG